MFSGGRERVHWGINGTILIKPYSPISQSLESPVKPIKLGGGNPTAPHATE